MGNITENKIDSTLTVVQMTTIVTAVNSIAAIIPEATLTEQQRSTKLSMDVDNKVFVEDAITEVGISGAGIIPPFIVIAGVKNDLTVFEQLDEIDAMVDNLSQKIKDAKRTVADEAMTAANAIYKLYEMAALVGIPGAQQGYDKLKARYKKQGPNPPVVDPV